MHSSAGSGHAPSRDPELLVARKAAEEQLLVAHQQYGALRLHSGPPMLTGLVTEGAEVASKGVLWELARDVLGGEAETKLASFENIVGVGIGEKITNDHRTGRQCVAVYVIDKLPAEALADDAIVPEEIKGVPTDVVATGAFGVQSERDWLRPAPSGVSLGHVSGTVGTLGFPARLKDGQRTSAACIVSCNHVLACENAAQVGDMVLQPARLDGGQPTIHSLAALDYWVDLRFGWWFGWRPNRVDAALAVVDDDSTLLSPEMYGVGNVSPDACPLEPDLEVYKVGRTSSLTHGTVIDIDASMRVDHLSGRRAYMVNQLVVESSSDDLFSKGGDSGALVVEKGTHRPVGMVCAGTPKGYSLVNPIQAVLDDLGVTFLW